MRVPERVVRRWLAILCSSLHCFELSHTEVCSAVFILTTKLRAMRMRIMIYEDDEDEDEDDDEDQYEDEDG